jgi:hypothetical protein
MDSTINLLPDKEKQLVKGKPKPRPSSIEMTSPRERVVQQRVVRTGGLMEFFRNLFKKKQVLSVKSQEKPKVPPVILPPTPPKAPEPITRIEAMPERIKPAPSAPAAQPQVVKSGFFQKVFSSPTAPTAVQSSVIKAPPPVPAAPAPIRRPAAWTPPPPSNQHTPPPPINAVPLPPVPPADRKPIGSQLPPVPKPANVSANLEQMHGQGLNVNLVPEEFQPEVVPKDKLIFVLSIVIAVVVIAVTAIGLSLYSKKVEKKVAQVDSELKSTQLQVDSFSTGTLNQAEVLKKLTSEVTTVLDQHVYWDTFFAKLEGVTLPNVTYSNMSVDIAGSVSLTAKAKTFKDVGDQLLVYQQATDFINSVSISSATKETTQTAGPAGATSSEDTVSFSVSLTVQPSIFFKVKP